MKSAMVVWKTMTDTHPGTGQDSSSVIDLPVAREGATGFPIVPGSTIKGVMRNGIALDKEVTIKDFELRALKRFGYTDKSFFVENEDGDYIEENDGGWREATISHIGDLSFTDARLFALAIPSYYGVFALVTCPMVVTRLNELLKFCGLDEVAVPRIDIAEPDDEADSINALVGAGSELHGRGGGDAIIHDYVFSTTESDEVSALADRVFKDALLQKERLLMVPDDVFSFLCETALPIMAHNSLDPDTKTVKTGALWYQENLPAECILTSFFRSSDGDLSIIDELEKQPYIQFGGKSTTGHGLVRQLTREVKQ